MPLALAMAQTFFAIALGVIALFITFFAIYVVSSTLWADRWIRHPKPKPK
jgi:hypothetical protein